MKFFFAIFVMVGVCAVNINGNPMHGPAMVNTGHSAQFRSQDVCVCVYHKHKWFSLTLTLVSFF